MPIRVCLTVAALALLAVGVASHSIERHAIQVAPLVLALGVAGRRGWSTAAAAGMMACWLVIMSLIWLYLLGLARVITGTFTPVEIALTAIVGASCALGLARARTTLPRDRWLASAAAFALGFAIQFAAVAGSYEIRGLTW